MLIPDPNGTLFELSFGCHRSQVKDLYVKTAV